MAARPSTENKRSAIDDDDDDDDDQNKKEECSPYRTVLPEERDVGDVAA
jgi:hypothetical protein